MKSRKSGGGVCGSKPSGNKVVPLIVIPEQTQDPVAPVDDLPRIKLNDIQFDDPNLSFVTYDEIEPFLPETATVTTQKNAEIVKSLVDRIFKKVITNSVNQTNPFLNLPILVHSLITEKLASYPGFHQTNLKNFAEVCKYTHEIAVKVQSEQDQKLQDGLNNALDALFKTHQPFPTLMNKLLEGSYWIFFNFYVILQVEYNSQKAYVLYVYNLYFNNIHGDKLVIYLSPGLDSDTSICDISIPKSNTSTTSKEILDKLKDNLKQNITTHITFSDFKSKTSITIPLNTQSAQSAQSAPSAPQTDIENSQSFMVKVKFCLDVYDDYTDYSTNRVINSLATQQRVLTQLVTPELTSALLKYNSTNRSTDELQDMREFDEMIKNLRNGDDRPQTIIAKFQLIKRIARYTSWLRKSHVIYVNEKVTTQAEKKPDGSGAVTAPAPGGGESTKKSKSSKPVFYEKRTINNKLRNVYKYKNKLYIKTKDGFVPLQKK